MLFAIFRYKFSYRERKFEFDSNLNLFAGLRSAKIVYNPLTSSLSSSPPQPLSSPTSSMKASKLTIILKCRVDGNHLDKIEWFKDGKPLKSVGLLIIHNPTQNNNGNYKCRAYNVAGMTESEPFHVEIQPYHIEQTAHNSFHSSELFCESADMLDNQIEKRALVCRYKHNSARLHRKRSTTEVGSGLSSSKQRKLKIDEDDSVTMHCDFSHLDRKANQLSVRWKKDNKLIRQFRLNAPNHDVSNEKPFENPLIRDDSRITTDPKNGSIKINSTIPSDSGVYEVSAACVADIIRRLTKYRSAYLSALCPFFLFQCTIHRNENAILSVQVSDLLVIEKLKFAPPPTSKGLEIGSVGKIHCKVQGTPTPQISWERAKV